MSDEVIAPAAAAVSGTETAATITPAPAGIDSLALTPVAETPVKVEPTWRDDWRDKLASEDKSDLKTLERIASVDDLWKQHKLLRQKMSSGELKAGPPKDATPEQLAEYRKEAGLPEKPEDYKLDLGGIIPTAADSPMMEEFKQFSHGRNIPPALASDLAKWYFEKSEEAIIHNKKLEQDTDYQRKIDAEVSLRQEWGSDYGSNLGTMANHLDFTIGAPARAKLMEHRGADGVKFQDSPEMMRAFAAYALREYPAAKALGGSEYVAGRGGEDRIAQIEKDMRTDINAYRKDNKLQEEYRNLLDIRDRAKGRAA